jgi:hypothetical protein
MRAMHHLFLGAQYDSLDMFLTTVAADTYAVLGSSMAPDTTDCRDLAARLVNELLTDTVQLVGNLCQLEQLLTEAQAGRRELKFQAFTDSLTKLLNRQGFLNLSRQRLRAASGERPVTCLLCDLDGFKPINDTHGHAIGDQAYAGSPSCSGRLPEGGDHRPARWRRVLDHPHRPRSGRGDGLGAKRREAHPFLRAAGFGGPHPPPQRQHRRRPRQPRVEEPDDRDVVESRRRGDVRAEAAWQGRHAVQARRPASHVVDGAFPDPSPRRLGMDAPRAPHLHPVCA